MRARSSVLVLLLACGSGSSAGIDEKKALSDLSDADYNRLCNWMNSQIVPLNDRACSDGTKISTMKTACVGNPYANVSCNTTVLGFETCIRTYAMNPCAYDRIGDVAECAGVAACVQ